jgi:hypothetical protein
MTASNHGPNDPETDPQTPPESATGADASDTKTETSADGEDGGDKKLTAAKRKAMRYGVKSQNAAEDNPKLARFTMTFVVAVIASIVLVNPAAAQCDEGAGLFILDMQEQIGAMVLGFLVLMALIALALILLPVAGTAAVGWTIIFAVGGALVLYMLAFWLFGQIGEYGVLGMEDACSPFY